MEAESDSIAGTNISLGVPNFFVNGIRLPSKAASGAPFLTQTSAALPCKMAAFKVGGDGKPVRPRRGPATVIGDASRIHATG
jgi:hypothetical protein